MKKILFLLIMLLSATGNIQAQAPRAIAMWDFSWLERRWPGAGFENWDKVLDEFTDRGYNAVRIDCYPHLITANPTGKWMLNEVWNQQDWGSPDMNEVQVQPALNEFLKKCKDRDVKVGLSSWYRDDTTHVRLNIRTPKDMANCWIATLKSIEKAGLLDNILYVDLCNEWPGDLWAPFFKEQYPKVNWGEWNKPESMAWMQEAIALVRKEFPDLPLLFSFDSEELSRYGTMDTGFIDLFEQHIWMVHQNKNEFNNLIQYKDGRFNPQAYKNVVKYAAPLYYSKPEYWNNLLVEQIERMAKVSRDLHKPLVTTECWAIVDYKDWPLLEWDWVKRVCEIGVKEAAASGQWIAIATNNFCGPQFAGMWNDIEWHRRMTSIIRGAKLDKSLTEGGNLKVLKRL